MAIQVLYRAQAFGTGCDLWITPQRELFTLFRKTDWYMNFQITKAERHSREHLSPQLKGITTENAFPEFSPELSDEAPLLLSAENYFPVKKIIELRYSSSIKNWAQNIHKIWTDLDRPALRVFLPTEVSPEDFKKNWPNTNPDDVTLVPA